MSEIKAPHNIVHEDHIEMISGRNERIVQLKGRISDLKEAKQSNYIKGLIRNLEKQLNNKLLEKERSESRIQESRESLVESITLKDSENRKQNLSNFDAYYGESILKILEKRIEVRTKKEEKIQEIKIKLKELEEA